jgi:REP element-mobilizing transposase RayT
VVRGAVGREHVHMLLSCPPSISPSKLMQYLKGRSSKMLQKVKSEIDVIVLINVVQKRKEVLEVKKLNKRFEKAGNSVFSFWTCPCFRDVCFGCSDAPGDGEQTNSNQLFNETYAVLYVTLGD